MFFNIFQIESFVFNEDDDDEDLEEDASLESQLKKEGYLCHASQSYKSVKKQSTKLLEDDSELEFESAIDSDTRDKLEALLASDGQQ